MKKYLYDYIKKIDNKLEKNKNNKSLKEEHLVKINFFQHERLIHLIGTLLFALLTFVYIYNNSIINLFNILYSSLLLP